MNLYILTVYIYLLKFSFVLSNKELDDKYGNVVYVNILYRHGDRTPIDPYPKDPYRNSSFWPVDWGQLTNIGKYHHYKLGQWFRARYDHLYPKDKFDYRTIYIRSTDVDRTLMSAQANTAGMFPPEEKDHWFNINWQPVPIHTIPEHLDKVLAMKAPCQKYETLLHKFKHSDTMDQLSSKFKTYFKYMSENTGEEVDLSKMENLYTTLSIEDLVNFTLPQWTKSIYPGVLREAAGINFAIPSYTTELKRLKGGPILKAMLGSMHDKLNLEKPLPQNISIYSAHDLTVSFLLNTLGVFNLLPPPFCSSVIVELRQKSNQNLVTIQYKNSTNEPYLLTIPGCDEACPLDKLAELMKPVIPEDWDSECHEHTAFDLSLDQPYNTLAIFAIVTSTMIVFILLASTSLYWHKKPSYIYKKLHIEPL